MERPALIFDLDGTLWDACVPVGEAWTIVGRRYFGEDYLVSAEMAKSQMGRTMDEIGKNLSYPGLDEDRMKAFMKECFDYEVEYLKDHPGALFEDEIIVLNSLKKTGFRLFIVSNCQCGYIENFLPLVEGIFEDYLCFGDTLSPKNVTIRELMKKHQLKDAIYIGDTDRDEVATRLAGLRFIHAAYGFGNANNPDGVVRQFGEYPIVLSEICKDF